MAEPTPEDLLFDLLDRRERGEAVDLDALCARHPAQAARLRELERDWRLAQGVTSDSELEADPRDDAVPPLRTDVDASLLAQLRERGENAGRYAIEGELGRGGMGVVLRVFDRDLRRKLAMKVMPDAVRERSGRLARFLEEAQVNGQLDHPGIVPVHELGLDRDGRVYFTMKLVRGETLEHVIAALARGEGDWNATRVVGVLLRVCEAMAFAHAKGVVHRDLKPSNVMVGRFGETYVMDWGVARVLGAPSGGSDPKFDSASVSSDRREQAQRSSAAAYLTHEGDVVGTPAYMPPEQAAGEIARIGPPADVYAIGAMLYHLLSGHMPYAEPGAPRNGAAVRQRLLEGPPVPLPRTAPPELAAICAKAMERSLDRRYPSMLALADDLRAYLEGRVVSAHATGALAELRKWIARNRATATAGLVAVLALIAVGVVQSLRRLEVEAERERVAERKSEFDQLAGKVYLERARAAADELYPAIPSRRADLQRWLDVEWARLEALRPRIDATIARIEDRVGRDRSVDDGPEGESQRFLHATLTQLAADIDAMARTERESVRARLAYADRLATLGADHPAARVRWADATAAIARADGVVASVLYRDARIELTPQLGLVPIGMNPVTKLWEFYDLRSACDLGAQDPATVAIPTHDAAGNPVGVADPGLVFVLLPGGAFDCGAIPADGGDPDGDPRAADDEGVRRVTLAPFFIARHEVTKGQWRRWTGNDPSFYRDGPPYDGDPDPMGPTHPVEQGPWPDADRTLRRAGLALPTEAQWEYAARAGTRSAWWSGREPSALAGVANVLDRRAEAQFPGWGRQEGDFDDGYCSLSPVGTFRANAFGLHDVHGNVWEWCADAYSRSIGASRDGDGLASGGDPTVRVLRGGSFNDPASLARCSSRSSQDGSIRTPAIGLRAVRALER
ncbi:MAG: SUMF1/EgtB/PvdO family nonheme iron enzyme [Planctomycetes bacterium]|nr:SUMF1/EgtB/PvdO family nonheme iron enzyme [Planctomycetota bacterium]